MLFQSLFIFLLFFVSSSFGSDVLTLTTDNFDEYVKSVDIMLVEFYAPWCGHCKKLEPEYAIAATELKNLHPPIPLGKVDGTVETVLAERYKISGYPSLRIFKRGSPIDYKGPRDAPGIIKWMKKQVEIAFRTLNSVEEVENFINHPLGGIIGFFQQPDSQTEKIFGEVADGHRESLRFGLVRDQAALEHFGYKQSIVICRPKDDDVKIIFSGAETRETLDRWVDEKGLPIVGEFNQFTSPIYSKKHLPTLKVYFDLDWESNQKKAMYYVNRLRKVANHGDLYRKLNFVVADKNSYKTEMDKYAASIGRDECMVVIDEVRGIDKYKFTGEFSIENVQKFVEDYLSKKLHPFIKSAPIPEHNDGPVTVVVGDTFRDIVFDRTKDVLLEVYAPWCGHCKKLEPIFTELGKTVAAEWDNLVIAKMDGTANDAHHPKYVSRGYPTLLFAPAGNKDHPVSYNAAERDVEHLLEFIEQNAKKASKKTHIHQEL